MMACAAPTWLALWPQTPRPLPPDALALRLDLNTATAAELDLLPGLGRVRAERIVAYRTQATTQPAFRELNDLSSVDGFGPTLLQSLEPHLRFPAPEAGE
jgi:competence protein ComEA